LISAIFITILLVKCLLWVSRAKMSAYIGSESMRAHGENANKCNIDFEKHTLRLPTWAELIDNLKKTSINPMQKLYFLKSLHLIFLLILSLTLNEFNMILDIINAGDMAITDYNCSVFIRSCLL